MSSGGEPVEGWGYPPAAFVAHYFGPDRRSLCGRWRYAGALGRTAVTKCRRCERLAARRAGEAAGEKRDDAGRGGGEPAGRGRSGPR